jgi:hypothetical protein
LPFPKFLDENVFLMDLAILAVIGVILWIKLLNVKSKLGSMTF